MTSCGLAEWGNTVYDLPIIPDDMKLLPEDYVFDPDKSVSWNKLQVTEHNLEYQNRCEQLKFIRSAKIDEWRTAVMSYIQSNSTYPITSSQAQIIYAKAYQDGHAYGLHDVMINVDELIEFLNELMR